MNITVTHTLSQEIIDLLQVFARHGGAVATPGEAKSIAPVKQIDKPATNGAATNGSATKEVTIEAVRAAVQDKAQDGKRDAVKKLLTEFGVSKVTDLAKDQYAPFLEKVNKI